MFLQPLLQQQIVRGHAGLPGIQDLAEGDAPGRRFQVGGAVQDHRALAPQLQGDGGQIFCRRPHHHPAHRLGAGEEDVVKGLLQQLLCLLPAPLDHRRLFPGQGPLQHPLHHLRRGRGVFRRLDHGAAPRRQGPDERHEAQVEGIVPRTDDEGYPQGPGPDLAAGGEVEPGHRAGTGAHPSLHMGQVISDLVEDQPRLAQIALAWGLAQVPLQRPGNVPLHILYCLIQGLQPFFSGR